MAEAGVGGKNGLLGWRSRRVEFSARFGLPCCTVSYMYVSRFLAHLDAAWLFPALGVVKYLVAVSCPSSATSGRLGSRHLFAMLDAV